MKTRLLFHDIEYWFEMDEGKELTEIDEEFIVYQINSGYSSGQLVSYNDDTDEETYGWWQIVGYETQSNPRRKRND